MKIVATIEARMSSTRLPGKVLTPLAGKPMLERIVDRVRPAQSINSIIVATSTESSDDPIEAMAKKLGIGCFRGSLEDVLGRLNKCVEAAEADLVVKLSGDNPLYHHGLVDAMVARYMETKPDFLGTTFMGFSKAWREERTFPLGLGVAVFPAWMLKEADKNAVDPLDRDGVVRYMIERPDQFRLEGFQAEGEWVGLRRPELRLTVDTDLDFEMMEAIFRAFEPDELFTIQDAIRFLDRHPEIRDRNREVVQKHLVK